MELALECHLLIRMDGPFQKNYRGKSCWFFYEMTSDDIFFRPIGELSRLNF